MKTFQPILAFSALWLAAVSLQAQTPVRVTADSVNIRAKPLLTSEVLTQANYDDRLQAFDIGEEWVEIAAPESVDFWVSKDFIQQSDNTVNTRRVNVRAGPSINYNVVDTLDRGAVVVPRGEADGWVKIAPPPSAHLYISREFVETGAGEAPVETAAVETAPLPPAAPETAAAEDTVDASEPAPAEMQTRTAAGMATPIVSPSVPAPQARGREIPVPPPANLKLIPLEGQGRLTEFEGDLRAAPLINEAPSRYRVVRWQNNRWQILCHVYGEASKFRSLQDKRVRVKGREYWIQGAAAPVLVPDQIQEVAAPAE